MTRIQGGGPRMGGSEGQTVLPPAAAAERTSWHGIVAQTWRSVAIEATTWAIPASVAAAMVVARPGWVPPAPGRLG